MSSPDDGSQPPPSMPPSQRTTRTSASLSQPSSQPPRTPRDFDHPEDPDIPSLMPRRTDWNGETTDEFLDRKEKELIDILAERQAAINIHFPRPYTTARRTEEVEFEKDPEATKHSDNKGDRPEEIMFKRKKAEVVGSEREEVPKRKGVSMLDSNNKDVKEMMGKIDALAKKKVKEHHDEQQSREKDGKDAPEGMDEDEG